MQRSFLRSYSMQQLLTGYETLAKAKAMGISASDEEVEKKREEVLKQQDVRKMLSLPANASVSDIDAALKQHNGSLETALPEADMKMAIMMQKLQDTINKGVVVTEQDTRDSYIQYHTRHILIDNKKRSDVQAEARAKEVLAKAQAPGANFAALAKQYSEDPGTKNKGGDDDWIDANTPYVEEFKTAAFALKSGQVTTDLVKSPQFGYFIIKLDGTRNHLPTDFDKKKAEYIAKFAETKKQQAMSKFNQELQAAPHKVVMIDPQLKADKEFDEAQRLQPPDPVKQAPMFNQAIADYQKAIKNSTNGQDKAAMYIQIANANQQLKNTAGQIAAYEEAVKANGTDDPNLLMTLGGLYKDQKMNDKAIDAYQRSSKAAWVDLNIHQSLASTFDGLHRKDLGDIERKWVADYQASHPQPKMGGIGGPAGQPISITPGGGKVTAKPITVAPAKDSATPPTVSVKDAAGKPAAQPIKPAQ